MTSLDQNYWNFCTAGASDATLAYWANTSAKVTGMAAAYFSEPYGPHIERHWYASSDTGSSSDTSDGYATVGRAYLMYLAEQVKPPSYTRPGIVNFDVYPTKGGAIADIRDALNWEASGHSASWSTFFYLSQNPSESDLHSFVTSDIANAGVAVVADVNTGYLPNWSRSLGHSIAIIGYNDTAATYTYLDTCGKRCNGSSSSKNGSINTISQHNMYLAIHSFGQGIVW